MVNWGDCRLNDKMWEKIHPCPMSGCWLWLGYLRPSGYAWGLVNGTRGKSGNVYRAMYKLLVGDPGELTLDHVCDTRSCVNPNHLNPTTLAQNVKDGALRRVVCRNGHPRTESTTRRNGRGDIVCLPCTKASKAADFQRWGKQARRDRKILLRDAKRERGLPW